MPSEISWLPLIILMTCGRKYMCEKGAIILWRPKFDLNPTGNIFIHRGRGTSECIICPNKLFQNNPNVSVSILKNIMMDQNQGGDTKKILISVLKKDATIAATGQSFLTYWGRDKMAAISQTKF